MATTEAVKTQTILGNEKLLGDLVEQLCGLVDEGRLELAAARIELFHPADQAEVLEALPDDERERLLRHLSDEDIAEILEYLDTEPRSLFLKRLAPEVLARILVFVDDELAADIVEELPDDKVNAVLSQLDNREEVTELLDLPPDCVGRWMSKDVISLKVDWTVEEAFGFLRTTKPETGEHFYLYVVDDSNKLCGVVTIRTFITAPPNSVLRDIMETDVIRLEVRTDQEEAAEQMRHYGLMALPVVDEEGRLEGLLRADEVLHVQVEEATEDIFLQVGLDADASPFMPVREAFMQRAPWLFMNLFIGFVSALIVRFFHDTLDRVALLAAFMPIVAGHGGNTGCQTSTLIVRGIALGDIYKRDLWEVLLKEMAFGLLYGALAGSLTGLVAYMMSHNPYMAVIVFAAMVGNVVLATMGGALIPLGLRALGFDPALASTVWLTTVTDWLGFLLLLGLGSLLIGHLQ